MNNIKDDNLNPQTDLPFNKKADNFVNTNDQPQKFLNQVHVSSRNKTLIFGLFLFLIGISVSIIIMKRKAISNPSGASHQTPFQQPTSPIKRKATDIATDSAFLNALKDLDAIAQEVESKDTDPRLEPPRLNLPLGL